MTMEATIRNRNMEEDIINIDRDQSDCDAELFSNISIDKDKNEEYDNIIQSFNAAESLDHDIVQLENKEEVVDNRESNKIVQPVKIELSDTISNSDNMSMYNHQKEMVELEAVQGLNPIESKNVDDVTVQTVKVELFNHDDEKMMEVDTVEKSVQTDNAELFNPISDDKNKMTEKSVQILQNISVKRGKKRAINHLEPERRTDRRQSKKQIKQIMLRSHQEESEIEAAFVRVKEEIKSDNFQSEEVKALVGVEMLIDSFNSCTYNGGEVIIQKDSKEIFRIIHSPNYTDYEVLRKMVRELCRLFKYPQKKVRGNKRRKFLEFQKKLHKILKFSYGLAEGKTHVSCMDVDINWKNCLRNCSDELLFANPT